MEFIQGGMPKIEKDKRQRRFPGGVDEKSGKFLEIPGDEEV